MIRIVQRTRQSIHHHADDDENPPEEHFEDQTKENEMAQEDDIIKVLEDASDNPNIEAELQVIEDESDNVQGGKVSVKLTITKTSTIMEPFCRLNKVVFLILAFLLVATSIFILFLVYVFKGIGWRQIHKCDFWLTITTRKNMEVSTYCMGKLFGLTSSLLLTTSLSINPHHSLLCLMQEHLRPHLFHARA